MQAARMILKNVVWMHKGKHLLETMEYLAMSDPSADVFKVEQNTKSLIKAFQIRAKEKAMECAMALNANPKDFNKHQPFLVREMVETYHQLYLAQTFQHELTLIHNEKVKEVFT